MSKMIQLLQQIGQSAELQSANKEVLDAFIQASDVPEELKTALIAGEHQKLNTLLGGRSTIICGLLTPDDEEGDKTPPNDEEITLAA